MTPPTADSPADDPHKYDDLDNILIAMIQDGDWTPGTWITKTTAFNEAKAALELWKQRAVVEARIDELRNYYRNHPSKKVAVWTENRIQQLTAQPHKEDSV